MDSMCKKIYVWVSVEWVGSNVRISVVNIEIPIANDGNSARRKLGHGDLLQSNV